MSYTQRFKNKKLASYYQGVEYGKNSYYSYIWELEQRYLVEIIKKLRQNKKNISYLDFACGTGRIIAYVEKYVDSSVGLDVSDEMIEIAQKRVFNSTLIKSDILKNPINSKYDLITAFRFFLNAENSLRNDILRALKKNMRKDSVLVISIHGNSNSARYISYLVNKMIGKRLNQLSYEDTKQLVAINGLEIVDWVGIGLMPKVLYRIRPIRKMVFKIDAILYENKFLYKFCQTLVFCLKINE